ncbi:Stk1 family PASTA domain-containing Ser/Thr kinase [Miniimonas arenae]|uniref:Stk1 family PASTA domain-containing Ser/Thr kinase n=1 Tax=Miniimonas arenae TaxID=676201 RepID=UPI0028A75F4F|nr:Stk1 family PASTA domain-containing Ser/Thr kinase [Miniimonas arenae]
MVDQIPRVLAGRYEIGELIGRGGMAEVHIGRDNRLSRRVAIKLLRSDLAQDSTFQARFRREAQSAAALNHPKIVSVYDTGEDTQTLPDGTVRHSPFIVMEYVEGHTVRELLKDGAALPIEEAVEITEGVLQALEYSHHAGIIHRDIKPANVMITTAGDVKVMDFGIARAVADTAATMTQTQAVVGTAQYLSPEQARGEVVDARSDVYSTGALLFELLTGRPPFVGDSPVAVAYQHVREEPPTPSSVAADVPEELDRITLKALAKDRTVRYQSAEEFRADLVSAQRGGVVGAPAVGVIAAANAAAASAAAQRGAPTQILGGPPTATTSSTPPVPPAEEDPKKGRAWVWVLVVLGILLAAAIVWALTRDTGEPDDTPSPTPTVTMVEVPDVVGETEAQATRDLQDVGLVAVPQTAADATVPAGSVVSTDPAAGVSIAQGLDVTIVVSTGPDALAVPDVLGMTDQQAQQALTNAGFTPKTIIKQTANSATFSAGQVMAIDPGVGTSVAPDSQFTLTIATGKVDVPDLTGMTREQAQQALQAASLTGNFEQTPNGDHDAGTVISWNPTGSVDRLSQITVLVATEPTEVATPTTPPTGEATGTPSPGQPDPPGGGNP